MKKLILCDYNLVSEYIKDALSELQPYSIDKYSWFKGKFYTKELYLVEKYDQEDLGILLDFLINNDEPIKSVISIGMAQPLVPHLKQGDIIINDYPGGSCQVLVDRFLNNKASDEEESPLRIFAGTIFDQNAEENPSGLACLDLSRGQVFATTKAKGLPTLAIRIIGGENQEKGLDPDIASGVIQKLLLLLKQTVEQVS